MNKADKRAIYVFGGLIAVLTVAGIVHVLLYSGIQLEARRDASKYEVASSARFAACAARDSEFARLACLAKEIEAEQQQQRQRADLHAQQDMATWAAMLLWVSAIGIVISASGIWFVYENLREMRRQTVVQSRPLLKISAKPCGPLIWDEKGWGTGSIEIIVENTGSGVAYDVDVGIETLTHPPVINFKDTGDHVLSKEFASQGDIAGSPKILFMNDELAFYKSARIDGDVLNKLSESRPDGVAVPAQIYVLIRVMYRSLISKKDEPPFKTAIAFKYGERSSSPVDPFFEEGLGVRRGRGHLQTGLLKAVPDLAWIT